MFKLSKSKHPDFIKIHKQAVSLIDSLPIVKRKRRRRKIFKTIRYFSYSIIFSSLIIFIVFISYTFTLKEIYTNVVLGESKLEYSSFLIKMERYKEAVELAYLAENNFTNSLNQLQEIKENS